MQHDVHYQNYIDEPYEVVWIENGKQMSKGERSYRAAETRARQKEHATIQFKRGDKRGC